MKGNEHEKSNAIGIMTTVLGLYGAAAQNSQSPPSNPVPKAAPAADNGVAALRRAAEGKQYLFVFVYEQEDEETRAARKTFEAAVQRSRPRPKSVRRGPAPTRERRRWWRSSGLQTAPVPIGAGHRAQRRRHRQHQGGRTERREAPGRGGQPRPAADPQGGPGGPARARVPAKRPDQGQRRRHERREGDQGG